MVVGFEILHGDIDNFYRPLVGLYLDNGEYFRAHIDTGFNRTLLFSALHAIEIGIGLPSKYDVELTLAGGLKGMAGKQEVFLRWFDGPLSVDALILEIPVPGSRAKTRREKNPLALLGMRLLVDCNLSILCRENFSGSIVEIRKA